MALLRNMRRTRKAYMLFMESANWLDCPTLPEENERHFSLEKKALAIYVEELALDYLQNHKIAVEQRQYGRGEVLKKLSYFSPKISVQDLLPQIVNCFELDRRPLEYNDTMCCQSAPYCQSRNP